MRKQNGKLRMSGFIKHHDSIIAAIILTPMILWWVVVSGVPLVFGFGLGFFDWRVVTKLPDFAGLKNFITFFTDKSYLMDLWRSAWIGVLSSIIVVVFGLILGMLLNSKIRFKGFYRTIWYLPAVTSTVAITQVISILLIPGQGINGYLQEKGVEMIILDTSFEWSVVAILVFSLWRGVGSNAVLWLAGLQSIEPVLYEAASIDGANTMQKFLKITLPGLKPMATYVIINSIIGSLQIYEPVAFITRGGPNNQTRVLTLRILEDAYKNFNFGMAGASGLILAMIIFVCTISYYIYTVKRDKEEDR